MTTNVAQMVQMDPDNSELQAAHDLLDLFDVPHEVGMTLSERVTWLCKRVCIERSELNKERLELDDVTLDYKRIISKLGRRNRWLKNERDKWRREAETLRSVGDGI